MERRQAIPQMIAFFPSQIELKRNPTPKKHKKKAIAMPKYPINEQMPPVRRANAIIPK
jgi:hypothetical protein